MTADALAQPAKLTIANPWLRHRCGDRAPLVESQLQCRYDDANPVIVLVRSPPMPLSETEANRVLPGNLGESHRQELKLLAHILAARAKQPGIDLRETRLEEFTWECDKRARLVTAALALAVAARRTGSPDLTTLCEVLQNLLRRDLGLDRDTVSQLLSFVETSPTLDLKTLPLSGVLQAIEKATVSETLPLEWKRQLTSIAEKIKDAPAAGKGTAANLVSRIEKLCDASLLTRFTPDEGWADQMRADLAALDGGPRRDWEALLQQAAAVLPEPPANSWDVPWQEDDDHADAIARRRFTERVLKRGCSAAWQAGMRQRVEAIGLEDYLQRVIGWLHDVPKSKPGHLARASLNREVLRGLLWSLLDHPSPATVGAIGVAASFFYKKNSPLALDSVRILCRLATPEALNQLTVLSGRVKAAIQKETIQAARELVAAHHGISVDDLDDLAIPTSAFTEPGIRREVLNGFTAEIAIERRTATLRWFKANGQPVASVPAAVKRDHASELNDLKRAVKEVETTLSLLANRFETAPLAQRYWNVADWKTRYLEHPVVGTIVRRLVWELSEGDQRQSAVWVGLGFVDRAGQPLGVSDTARISVWHPIGARVDDVVAWRNGLTDRQITQPYKQAHREIYVLTDAERATEIYSNRFAGHILRQSQFRALAKARGWKADYLGLWSGGSDGIASIDLPRWRLRAELWCGATGDDQALGHGHVVTDQVRFCRLDNAREPLALAEIPPLVFSEVLRDVDLFVGVASVGNDPNWHDGGPGGRYRAYWHEYSFGPLNESANTRRSVLERLIPRMKIAERCRFDGRFLLVRGDLRTYKIHLGSSNILMQPNDQYLCIVPDSRAVKSQNDVYLPFEGDSTLSVILSKALLLSDDLNIKDPTITRQIHRT